MIVARPIDDSERNLLTGHEHEQLVIKNLDDEVVKAIDAPSGGWTLETLEGFDYSSVATSGWDAYLGKQWIGSSEV